MINSLSPFANPPLDVIQLEGERHVPLVKRYNAAMHLGHMAAYREALRYAYGRRVLDVGCGSGYGAFFLACYSGNQVEALDVHQPALDYARQVYAHPRLHFKQADALAMPFPDASFDFVFSSQVIEHLSSTMQFLAEIKRVLRPDGFCLVTTPNRLLFSPDNTETNVYHINEMALNEYQAQAEQFFPRVAMRGIPQNCLERLPGTQLPVLKPNARINADDYQVRDSDLDKCENLLMYGHKQPDGKFINMLPMGLQPASDITAPIFYDPQLKQMVAMGLFLDRQHPGTTTAVDHDGRLFSFVSPLDALYRLELRLIEPAPLPFTVECSNRRGGRLAVQTFGVSTQEVELIFSPQKRAEGAVFHLFIKPQAESGETAHLPQGFSVFVNSDHRDSLQLGTFHHILPSIST